MKKNIITHLFIIGFLTLTSSATFAENLKPSEFKNQFDEVTYLNKDTQWILFSKDKTVSDLINKQLEVLKITDIASLKGLYVAEISKMPSLITSMFALPKMKKYPFKVALDREGTITQPWPYKESTASFIKLKELEIIEVAHLKTEEEIKAKLTELNKVIPAK